MRPSFNLGEPLPPERSERLLCGFVSTLPEQDGQTCVERAELHLLVQRPDSGGLGELLTCTGHYPPAIRAAREVDVHEVGMWCALPGTLFDSGQGACILDGSGVES